MQPSEGEYQLVDGRCHDLYCNNLDVFLSLVEKGEIPVLVPLSIRVTQQSTSFVAGEAIEQAQTSVQKLSEPPVAGLPDVVKNVTNVVSNQNLITSSDSLMKKIGVLVKVGNEVAKVRPLEASILSHLSKINQRFILTPTSPGRYSPLD